MYVMYTHIHVIHICVCYTYSIIYFEFFMHTNYYRFLTHLSIIPSPRGATWADLKKQDIS